MTGGSQEPQTYFEYNSGLAAQPPAEGALIDKMIADLKKNSEIQYARSRKNPGLWRNGKPHAIRDAHAKSCGILRGKLTVNADLRPDLRQGMFAEPGKSYDLIARISTTSGAIRSDQVRGVRGLGIKVLRVENESGKRASDIDNFKDSNQDFVMVTEPAFPFRDVADYANAGMKTANLLARTPDPVMKVVNRLLRTARRVIKLTGKDLPRKVGAFADPNFHVLGQTFYTAAPIRFGQYVAKLSVKPSSEAVKDLVGLEISRLGPDALTEAVVAFFASNNAEYTVSAQLCTNVADMPIEDATKEWSVSKSPYVPIATISYPRQTAYSDELQNYGDDELTFNSWRAIDEHRPLGGINRLKLRVYEASSDFRHNINGVARVEPTDLSRFRD
jgi:hypothetical protein